MIRIKPIIKQTNSITHYDSTLYYRNKSYNLSTTYYNLDIHSNSLDINHIQTPEPIKCNLLNYINYPKEQQHNGLHFARSIVNSSKYTVFTLPTHQFDHLQLYDKIGTINNIFHNHTYINHEMIYIGKHFDQHLFINKLNNRGIYFMTFQQIIKIANCFNYSIMVYRPNHLLTFTHMKYDRNIRRDHNYDN
jgi:hypothetical protein